MGVEPSVAGICASAGILFTNVLGIMLFGLLLLRRGSAARGAA